MYFAWGRPWPAFFGHRIEESFKQGKLIRSFGLRDFYLGILSTLGVIELAEAEIKSEGQGEKLIAEGVSEAREKPIVEERNMLRDPAGHYLTTMNLFSDHKSVEMLLRKDPTGFGLIKSRVLQARKNEINYSPYVHSDLFRAGSITARRMYKKLYRIFASEPSKNPN